MRSAVAVVVATIAFVAYTRTLLPGVDLGDTGAFQAGVLWPEITARRAYPLYFGLATPFVNAVAPGNPARALNLFSALWAAAAVGLLTWSVARVCRSMLSGAIAGLLLAFSYTFWTQSVIAEVYTLHLALIGAGLAALHAYAERPTTERLALIFAAVALSFGNHLATVLLLPPFAAFVLLSHQRPRELFTGRVVLMALGIAGAGALLYLPNLLAMLSDVDAPATVFARLQSFWFDVTKADWRGRMILGVVPADDRLAMWAWDARQQFGLAGVVVALAGAVRLWWVARPWAVLVVGSYLMTAVFALTYNVGDAHVFFLPSHFFAAFAAGAAFTPPLSREEQGPQRRRTATALRAAYVLLATGMLAYVGWRGADTWPAADRHTDVRAQLLATRLLAGVNERDALYVADMNWEIENMLLYASRYEQRDVAWVRALEILPHLPFVVNDNLSIGRDVVLSEGAAAGVLAAFGDALPFVPDEVPGRQSLSETVAAFPPGTPYVLAILEPLREYRYDTNDLGQAIERLAGPVKREPAPYEVIAGVAGSRPTYHRSSRRPFRDRIVVLDEQMTVRMDAWLPTDTFRRGGFGHVIRGREPLLFIERGISLMWLGPDGRPSVAYASGPYANQARYRIPAGGTRLARSAMVESDRRLPWTAAHPGGGQ